MEGMEKAARVEIQMAVKILQRQLPHFPIESEQGKAVLSALKTLSNGFGKTEDKDQELIPAEVMQLLSALGPGAGAPSAPPGSAPMKPPGAGAAPPPMA